MSMTIAGLLGGLILGFAGSVGGFGAFVITLFLGVVGLAAGRLVEVRGDTRAFLGYRDSDRPTGRRP